jgi:outer membrane protein assembly factor BamB
LIVGRTLSALALVFALNHMVAAVDWTAWRGPRRDGVLDANDVPTTWPASLKPQWRVEIGEGYSSPVAANGRIFVQSRRDPDELVTAIDLATGKVAWQEKYAAPFTKNQYATSRAKGPHATPLVAANRVYTLGATGILTAWNAGTGAVLWRKDYSPSVDTSKLFCGSAASPLLESGALIVQVGSDIHGGRVMALDPASGAERWTWKGPGPGYASPVAIATGPTRQIVTMTEGSVIGLDAKSGAQLWSVPFADDWHENIVTPVWTGTHLIVSGPRQGTHAITLTPSGATWRASEAWVNKDVTMYMSTPVAADGVLYGMSSKRRGQFVAIDQSTGAVRWATEGRDGDHASILLTPTHVVLLTNNADLVLARRSPAKYDEERRYDVADSETWAVPLVLPDGLVVRDASAVVRLAAR